MTVRLAQPSGWRRVRRMFEKSAVRFIRVLLEDLGAIEFFQSQQMERIEIRAIQIHVGARRLFRAFGLGWLIRTATYSPKTLCWINDAPMSHSITLVRVQTFVSNKFDGE